MHTTRIPTYTVQMRVVRTPVMHVSRTPCAHTIHSWHPPTRCQPTPLCRVCPYCISMCPVYVQYGTQCTTTYTLSTWYALYHVPCTHCTQGGLYLVCGTLHTHCIGTYYYTVLDSTHTVHTLVLYMTCTR